MKPNISFLTSRLVKGVAILAVVGAFILVVLALEIRSSEEGRMWPKSIEGCLLEIVNDNTIKVHSKRGVDVCSIMRGVRAGHWVGFSERLGAAIMIDGVSERLCSVTFNANRKLVTHTLPYDWVFDWNWSLTDEILYKIEGSGDQVKLIRRNLLTREEIIQDIHRLPHGVSPYETKWKSAPSVSENGSITYAMLSSDRGWVVLYARRFSETPEVLSTGNRPHWTRMPTTIAYAPGDNSTLDINLVYTDIVNCEKNRVNLWRASGLWKLTSLVPVPQDRPWLITRIDSVSRHHLICQVRRQGYPDNWFYILDLEDGSLVQLPLKARDSVWFPPRFRQ